MNYDLSMSITELMSLQEALITAKVVYEEKIAFYSESDRFYAQRQVEVYKARLDAVKALSEKLPI